MHSGAPLCLALVGILLLAMVDAGGQMGASALGVPCVLVVMGSLSSLLVFPFGHWGILTGLALRRSGTD